MENTQSTTESPLRLKPTKRDNVLLGSAVVALILDFGLDAFAGEDKTSAASIGSDVAHIVAVGVVIAMVLLGSMWRGFNKVQKALVVVTMACISFSAVADLLVDSAVMVELASASGTTRAIGCVAALIAVFIGLANRRKAKS